MEEKTKNRMSNSKNFTPMKSKISRMKTMNNKMMKKSKVRVDMTNKWAIIKCNNNKDPNMKNS